MNALLTDLYQLTMACAYWKSGKKDEEACFHLFFRRAPFGNAFALACGIEAAADFLANFRFEPSEIETLAGLTGADGEPLFETGFLDYLRDLRFTGEVAAVREGEIVYPHEPLLRIVGPIIECQLVETALLNLVNFQTLVATKAARICRAAEGDPVLEFGLRRAQGPDGGLSASRAAYVGGCDGTSNVEAAHRFGIPTKGTHAHSWVMSFADEQEAFDTYADALPNNVTLLVDTYDTLRGVERAIKTGRRLREKGHDLLGIRLDSGDLAELSKGARRLLDEAGFEKTKIVASNDLDEEAIRNLKAAGAPIDIWGVGTKLATCFDQPALGGVYKLGAIRASGEPWSFRLKRSSTPAKISNPGLLQVLRVTDENQLPVDVLINEAEPLPQELEIVDPLSPDKPVALPDGAAMTPLLQPLIGQGKRLRPTEAIDETRRRCMDALAALPAERWESEPIPLRMEVGLGRLRNRLLAEAGKENT